MGHSPLLGTTSAPLEPDGRDTALLGPGDSSDTGADMMGLEAGDPNDPAAPVDATLRDDLPHPGLPADRLDAAATDAAGTGERRSAGADHGARDGADIGVDRIVKGPDGISDDEDVDLAFIDAAQAGDPLDEEDEEDEDEAPIDGDAGRPPEKNPVAVPPKRSGRG